LDDQDEYTELETEVENDDVPYVEYDISVSPSDPSLELLANQITREDIVIPFYQRKYVWKIEQASKLIESFLMGLPVPQVFLYVNNEDLLEVIDGQQRLMSVKYFLEGFFGEENDRGSRQIFRLKGLAERSEYNGKTFDQLEPRDQRKLRNSTLRAIHIKQLRPKGHGDAVFHIFERLNTGGTQLKPQEIRNAVYRGPIVKKIQLLNANEEWQRILGLAKPDKNQKDVELVLRLFSLYQVWQDYEKPMLRYLNTQMDENRKFDSNRAMAFEVNFLRAVELVGKSLEKPFRPKRVLNSAVLEAVMISVLELEDITQEQLASNYPKLFDIEGFSQNITGGTTDTTVLTTRIKVCKATLQNA
jgi:uncharacterized protein with ParB-like and HNH nuclease domain